MKKFAILLLTAVMGVTCLGGCGSSAGASDVTAETGTESGGELTLDAIKAKGKLVVATEAAYEPFEYLDGDQIIGYDADIFQLICDDLGVELDYQDMPFQGILAGLEAKKYDVAGACLGITKERADKYSMTYPIQEGTTVLIKRKDDDFKFSIVDDSLAFRMIKLQNTGKRVVVKYKQYVAPLPWRGSSDIIVTGVEE